MARVAVKPITLLLFGCFVITAHPVRAQSFGGSVLNSSTGNTDTATAFFSLATGTATYLQITLTNTSTFSNYLNPDLLSGLFFSIATNPTITPSSASSPAALVNPQACASSAVTLCSTGPVNVGNQWGYVFSATGFSSTAFSTKAQYGVAAPGYSTLTPSFGQPTPFGTNPPNLAAKGTPQLAFSLVGSAYNAGTSSISSSDPLLQNSIVFGFGLPSSITSLNVSNVTFAYGTAPDGFSAGTIPEPSSLAVFGTLLAFLGIARIRLKPRPSFI